LEIFRKEFYFLDAVSLNGFIPKIDTEMGKAQWTIGPLCRYAEDLPLVFSVRYLKLFDSLGKVNLKNLILSKLSPIFY